MKYFLVFSSILSVAVFLGYGFKKNEISTEWLSKDSTNVIKGFSILTVVWAHVGGMLGIEGIQFVAGVGVTLFLICSGYGIELSVAKNGITHFWRNRFIRVLIPFWGVELIGMIATQKFSYLDYLLDVLLVKRATGYGWFIRYIVVCYIIFYIIKIISTKLKIADIAESVLFIGVFIIWFLLASTIFVEPARPFTEPRQMLSFPFGILIAKNAGMIKVIDRKKCAVMLSGGGGNWINFYGNYATSKSERTAIFSR